MVPQEQYLLAWDWIDTDRQACLNDIKSHGIFTAALHNHQLAQDKISDGETAWENLTVGALTLALTHLYEQDGQEE